MNLTRRVSGSTPRRATAALRGAGITLALLGFTGVAVADLVEPVADAASVETPVTLYQGSTLVSGVSFERIELQTPGAGRIDMTLTDGFFPGPLGASSMAIVDGGTVLGVLDRPGTFSFEIASPKALFAYIYGVGSVALSTGTLHVNIVQLVAPPPIPLPPALWALLGGLGIFAWAGRRSQGRAVTKM